MDFYGNANLNYNNLEQTVIQTEVNFPESPVVGRIVFVDKRLYICAALNGSIPVWVPLTNTIETYIHNQSTISAVWIVPHKLNVTIATVQVYNSSGSMIIPDDVRAIDNNNVQISFQNAISGKAIITFGQMIPQTGIGLLQP